MSAVGGHAEAPAAPHKHGGGKALTWIGIVVVAIVVLAIAYIAWHRHHVQSREAADRARELDKGPVVRVSKATTSPAERDVTLPAEIRAIAQTTLYAKVSGYVKTMAVDKGDHVAKDQVLGTIDSPETDATVRQAQSDLAQAKRNYERAKGLAVTIISQQDFENVRAAMHDAQENLARAVDMQEYEIIRAPFAGVVSMRYVDPGALIPAATAATQSAQPVFDVVDPSRLRIQIYVGQELSSLVHPGDRVSLWPDENPGAKTELQVTRVAGALDPRTRTELVEIEVDGKAVPLMPGTFAHAALHVKGAPLPVIPAAALLLRQGKSVVAVVDGGKVHYVDVTTGITDAKTMQVTSGLQGGELVAMDPPSDVEEGAVVQPKETPPPPPSGPGRAK